MDSIWFNKEVQIAEFEQMGKNTMGDFLGMKFTEIGKDFLVMEMPVNERTRQPYGILHGGASVALAETVGSIASALVIDTSKFYCVGMEVNANHIRSAKDGFVTATCKPLHIGRTSHVWDIKITNEQGKLVCVSRLTVAVIGI